MKRFYSLFRIFLATLAVGLAVIPFANGIYEKWAEIPVDLPKVESSSPIEVILPTECRPFNMESGCGSACGDGNGYLDEYTRPTSRGKKIKKKRN